MKVGVADIRDELVLPVGQLLYPLLIDQLRSLADYAQPMGSTERKPILAVLRLDDFFDEPLSPGAIGERVTV